MTYFNYEGQDRYFKPQEISNIVWGLANLQLFITGISPKLTEEFLVKFIQRIELETFPPQELNNAVWVRLLALSSTLTRMTKLSVPHINVSILTLGSCKTMQNHRLCCRLGWKCQK